jgi:hypothetical protein
VVEQQNPYAFPSYSWDQSPFHSLLHHEPHGPSGIAFRRVAADHGDDTLLLAVLQHRDRSGPRFIMQRPIKASFQITVTDLPNRLRR